MIVKFQHITSINIDVIKALIEYKKYNVIYSTNNNLFLGYEFIFDQELMFNKTIKLIQNTEKLFEFDSIKIMEDIIELKNSNTTIILKEIK